MLLFYYVNCYGCVSDDEKAEMTNDITHAYTRTSYKFPVAKLEGGGEDGNRSSGITF